MVKEQFNNRYLIDHFGLEKKPAWQSAMDMAVAYLKKEKVDSIDDLLTTYVDVAKTIMKYCDDVSEESVTVVLLGPASDIRGMELVERLSIKNRLGDRAFLLAQSMTSSMPEEADAYLRSDYSRVILAKTLVMMQKQILMVGVKDKFHEDKKQTLTMCGDIFSKLLGNDQSLDEVYQSTLISTSRHLQSLEQGSAKAPNLKLM